MRNIIIILVIAVVAFFVWKFIPRNETAIYNPNIITETTQTPEGSDQTAPTTVE